MFELQSKTGGGVAIYSPLYLWRDAIFFLTAVVVTVVDQITKTWIRFYAEGETIFESALLRIIHGQNTGAIFGTFQGFSFALTITTAIVILGLIILVFVYWRRAHIFDNTFARIAVSLYIGGATGNLLDRVRFGSVTDFLDFRVWPVFNVADASMTVAVIMFLYSLLFIARPGTQR